MSHKTKSLQNQLKIGLFTITLFVFTNAGVSAQGVAINETNAPPHSSAMLDVTSTNKGVLIPRMTAAQRNAIVSPQNGLLIFQTDIEPGFYYNAGTPASPDWQPLGQGGEGSGQWLVNGNNIYYSSGNVGIGTANPNAALHVLGTGTDEGNILSEGEFKDPVFQGDPPATGSGTRLMWYPDKAAFRAGQVNGTQWNKNNIGQHSIAMGYNTAATGDYSLAAGYSTQATGIGSIALGYNTAASIGHSTALGFQTTASGAYSTATGSWTTAPSGFETVIGRYNSTYTPSSSAGWVESDRLFVIGNGTSSANRSDALVVLKNGNVGIGVTNPTSRITVDFRVGTAGMHLLGYDNYYQSNFWQFGSTESYPEQGVFGGDFVLKSGTTYHYTYWTSYFRPTTDNTKTLGGSGYRWSTVYAANGTINTSDAREKQNIRPARYGLDAVMKMNPVLFEWKDKPEEGSKLGFLAQDLLNVVPEVVVTKEKEVDRETGAVSFKDADKLGVYYSDIIPVLVKAIQEQQAIIEEQNKRIEALGK